MGIFKNWLQREIDDIEQSGASVPDITEAGSPVTIREFTSSDVPVGSVTETAVANTSDGIIRWELISDQGGSLRFERNEDSGGPRFSVAVDKINISGDEINISGSSILISSSIFGDAGVGFNGVAPSIPEVPAISTAQDVIDALVTLGLITQAS